jgi:hypothetical protein
MARLAGHLKTTRKIATTRMGKKDKSESRRMFNATILFNYRSYKLPEGLTVKFQEKLAMQSRNTKSFVTGQYLLELEIVCFR